MKINILALLMVLLASNTFAGEKVDTIFRIDSVEKKHSDLLHDFDSYKKMTNKIIGELNNNDSEHAQSINELGKKYDQLLFDFSSYQQDLNTTIVGLNNKNNEQSLMIKDLVVNYNQLLQKLSLYQQDTNNTIAGLNNNDNKHAQSINELKKNIKQLSHDFDMYIQKTDKEVNSINIRLETKANINNISELRRNTISQQKIYFSVAIALSLLIVMIVFFYFKKQLKWHHDIFTLNHDDICKLREEGIRIDQRLTDIIETQLKVLEDSPVVTKEEPDHSLALKVADEIIRIQKNISRMDKKTKGLKQLSASVKRIQDNFASNGYELVEMLGQPYKEGLKASVNFISDDELEEGLQIITRITKPQVNYKGTMIQTAQIEVSQG